MEEKLALEPGSAFAAAADAVMMAGRRAAGLAPRRVLFTEPFLKMMKVGILDLCFSQYDSPPPRVVGMSPSLGIQARSQDIEGHDSRSDAISLCNLLLVVDVHFHESEAAWFAF